MPMSAKTFAGWGQSACHQAASGMAVAGKMPWIDSPVCMPPHHGGHALADEAVDLACMGFDGRGDGGSSAVSVTATPFGVGSSLRR